MVTRYNADLANGYGNLVSRVLKMISKYFDGAVPEYPTPWDLPTLTTRLEIDNSTEPNDIVSMAELAISMSDLFLKALNFAADLTTISALVATIDQVLSVQAPWKQDAATTEGRKRIGDTLSAAAEGIRIITILLYPVMPYATTRVWQQLGLDAAELTTYNVQRTTLLTWGQLKPGTKLGPLSPIFPARTKDSQTS